MSRLNLAADRLKTALERLEQALAARQTDAVVQENLQGRVAELVAEREQLQLKVAALEDEVNALSGITEDVEERLDGAIGEIRAALAR